MALSLARKINQLNEGFSRSQEYVMQEALMVGPFLGEENMHGKESEFSSHRVFGLLRQ